jgi:hypothetical protein
LPLPSLRYRRRPGFVHRWSRGEVIVVGPGEDVRTITGTAALTWEVLDGRSDLAELCQRIGARWEAAAGIEPQQVDDALEVLLTSGLVEATPAD